MVAGDVLRAAGGGRRSGDGLEPKRIRNVKNVKTNFKKLANPKCPSENLTCNPHQSGQVREQVRFGKFALGRDLARSTQFLHMKMRIGMYSRSCFASDLAQISQFLQMTMRIAIVL